MENLVGKRNYKKQTIRDQVKVRRKKSSPALSPLRYPGSKRRLVKQVENVLLQNNLRPPLFVEPFAGGASVALQLLQNGTVEKIGLVDLDSLVASFWKTVFFDTKWLVNKVRTVEVTLAQWRRFKKYRGKDVRTQALACLFLNRTSFSGILAKGAGVIGGTSQKSKYKIDCRFSRETLVQRIELLASMRDRVDFIWNCSWDVALTRLEKMKMSRDDIFLYIDPPFFEKADKLYRFYFNENQHLELRDRLLTTRAPWLLSYDSPEKAERLYSEAKSLKKIGMNYTAQSEGGFRAAQEILISNYLCFNEKCTLAPKVAVEFRHTRASKAVEKTRSQKPKSQHTRLARREVKDAKHQPNTEI
ncbi:MAG: DNA adenine methylase [Bdellovibrionaceae bacterium]|nr:DNA adenine methylase [Pseudobdellovibrionaceae bacterium]